MMRSPAHIELSTARLLIVDDQEPNVRLIELILQGAGFHEYRYTTDSRQAVPLCLSFQPDLLLLDLQMPHHDGFAVMAQLAEELPAQTYLPILVLTADITVAAKQRALASGANDFLAKPLDPVEVILRINNLLHTRKLYQELQQHNATLEDKVRERTQRLAEAQVEIVERLALAAEYRDDATGHHTQRVGKLSAMIARSLGQPADYIHLLRLAATLHDVGKIGIPDQILLKPAGLTHDEFATIKSHTTIGGTILGDSKFALLQMAREIALSHHERWDGTGYPQGLKGAAIPLSGRIVAIADVFDALTHDRPYKKAWTLEEAAAEITMLSGRQFDPDLVEVFLAIIQTQGLQNLASSIEASEDRVVLPAPQY